MKELVQLFPVGFGGGKVPQDFPDTICIDGHAHTVRLSRTSGYSREPLFVDVNDVLRSEFNKIAELGAFHQYWFIP